MNQAIVAAIKGRSVIRFFYDGEQRTVEPHCYGIDMKGHEALRAWQIGKGWRLFHVSEATGITTTRDTFYKPRDGYNPHDKHMQRIIAAL